MIEAKVKMLFELLEKIKDHLTNDEIKELSRLLLRILNRIERGN